MYRVLRSKKFKKSLKKIERNKNFNSLELENVLIALANGKVLDKKYKDHKLSGDYLGYRECHVQNDILLVYSIESEVLVLYLLDIGSHSDLF